VLPFLIAYEDRREPLFGLLDGPALCRGAQRDGPADTTARASDEQGFAFESPHNDASPYCRCRLGTTVVQPNESCWRSKNFWIFPDAVRGNWSTKRQTRGTL
jgi:hypothetical protein